MKSRLSLIKIGLASFAFGLAVLMVSCKEATKIDLNVPDKVVLTKTDRHIQMPGTRTFVSKPDGYTLLPSLIRLERDTSTYIQIIEAPGASYTQRKSFVLHSFDSLEAIGFKIYYRKEFMLGEYEAFISYAPDNRPGKEQILLAFGDDSFLTMATGVLSVGDEKAREEILAALLTAYVDKSTTADYSELANFTIDVSKTEFRFNSNMSQIFYYTVNGQGNPTQDIFENLALVMTLPPMGSFEERKSYARSLIERYKTSKIEIPSFEEQEIQINGEPAYEISFTGSLQGKSVKTYLVVVGNDKATILFTGSAFDRQNELYPQFVTMAQTLRVK